MNTPLASDGFRCGTVAIVGCPNVGKSTLLNTLIGQKISITSSKPQTTRLPILGIVTQETAQYVFVDTPGYQTKHKGTMNTRINQAVRGSLKEGIDAVIWVVEVNRYGAMDAQILDLLPKDVPKILVISKIDSVADKRTIFSFMEKLSALTHFRAVIPVSAHKNTQLDAIFQELRPLLPEQAALFPADELTTASARYLAAEILREKVFRQMGDEIPYASTVVIDQFEDEGGTMYRIAATIIVNRATHKPMLLGKDGEKIKHIATEARKDMEKLYGRKVFLQTWIKVREDWVEDARHFTPQ